MAVKTITIDMRAYEILKSLKNERESFSQVIKNNLKKKKTFDELMKTLDDNILSIDLIESVECVIKRNRKDMQRLVDF